MRVSLYPRVMQASLSLLLAVSLLAACGSSRETPRDVGVIDSTGCMPFDGAASLADLWSEEAYIECGTGTVVSSSGIQELNLTASGVIEVTWMPFETYKDYWGTFGFSAEGGFRMDVDGGNYIPTDIDSEGCVSIDSADRLVLSNMFLGTAAPGGGTAACGHRFTRR
jgi:hypothetical protein